MIFNKSLEDRRIIEIKKEIWEDLKDQIKKKDKTINILKKQVLTREKEIDIILEYVSNEDITEIKSRIKEEV